MYEAAKWLAVGARYMRPCWGSHPRTTVKNESGTHDFPCSSVEATPYWGKGQQVKKKIYIYLSIYITWPFPPVWGVADNTKETTKTMGISLRSSGNDEGPSRVWMAPLEQHSPSSPVFHNLCRFIYAISPTAPTTGLLL